MAQEFGGRVRFVSEDLGNSEVAKRFGVARYPALFLGDVLVAKPKDFGFYGKGEGAGDGRYTPFKSAESHARLQADLRRMLKSALAGEKVAGVAEEGGDELAKMPEFALRDLAGREVTQAELAGKVVLVEFWATWCPPCRVTLKFLDGLAREFRGDVVVLAAAVESDESNVIACAAGLPSIRFAMATPEFARSFGDVNALPAVHVFGRDGRRLDSCFGAKPDLHENLDRTLRTELARPTRR